MLAYSARKKNIKITAECSVIKPLTNSDSASAKSNGALFVSAIHPIKNTINIGSNGITKKTTFCASTLTVAFVTIAERKTMSSMQRRLGPNIVGYYGLLQAFADALKLLLKEYVGPTQANLILFFLGPIITLIFSLLGYAVIPYGLGLTIVDLNLGILYMLVVSSLSTYGILLAG